MENLIVRYQQEFNKICEHLRNFEKVRAATVFGSMVTGDIWEESDIDMILVLDEDFKEIRNIYSQNNKVPIHIKLISKKNFLNFQENNNIGGALHKDMKASRLIFSKDLDVTDKFNHLRYFINADEKVWSLVYLSALLKDIKVCRKYLVNDGRYTSFNVAVRCAESFSKLFVNNKGYMVSKDALAVAVNLDDQWRELVENLFFGNSNKEESIKAVLSFIERYLSLNIEKSCKLLLDILKEKNDFISSEELKNINIFKGHKISMEDILEKLYEKEIIKRAQRDFLNIKGVNTIKENVYSYKWI